MKIIKTQNKKQQKMPTKYSILYSELVPLTRDVNTLKTLEIRRKSRWSEIASGTRTTLGHISVLEQIFNIVKEFRKSKIVLYFPFPQATDPPTINSTTTDQPITNHLATDQPTHQPPTHQPQTHWPTDPRFIDLLTRSYFKGLIIKKIFILRNTNKAEKTQNYT